MQIVIEIPDELKRALDNNEEYRLYTESVGHVTLMAIKNGTPLPEYHGRLVDADALEKKMLSYHDDCAQTSEYTRLGFETAMEVVKDADTIIPATKEGE